VTKLVNAKSVLVLFLAFGLVAVLGGPTFAQKAFKERIVKVYDLDKTKNGNCHLCHAYDKEKKESPDKDNLNVFCKDIAKRPEMKTLLGKDDDYKFTKEDIDKVEAAVKALENVDSDGDGATNLEELKLGTFPGDPKSKPTDAQLASMRKK